MGHLAFSIIDRLKRYHSYRMFEVNMDEYLDEEIECVKAAFDVICRDWDKKVNQQIPSLANLCSRPCSWQAMHKPHQPSSARRTPRN